MSVDLLLVSPEVGRSSRTVHTLRNIAIVPPLLVDRLVMVPKRFAVCKDSAANLTDGECGSFHRILLPGHVNIDPVSRHVEQSAYRECTLTTSFRLW